MLLLVFFFFRVSASPFKKKKERKKLKILIDGPSNKMLEFKKKTTINDRSNARRYWAARIPRRHYRITLVFIVTGLLFPISKKKLRNNIKT